MKICNTCNEEKQFEEYYKTKAGNHRNTCKTCITKRKKENYKKRKEEKIMPTPTPTTPATPESGAELESLKKELETLKAEKKEAETKAEEQQIQKEMQQIKEEIAELKKQKSSSTPSTKVEEVTVTPPKPEEETKPLPKKSFLNKILG